MSLQTRLILAILGALGAMLLLGGLATVLHVRERIEADATAALQAAGFQVDYAVLRTPELAEPAFEGGGRVALIAARLGTTRLIDNLEF